MCNWVEASAPGKLMLFGEHAVLHGRLAVVTAVNRRIHVRLDPRDDVRIVITSRVGCWEGSLDDLEADDPRFRFVVAAMRERRDRLPGGLELAITSDFSPEVGLGSSGAVTAATVAALRRWCGEDTDRQAIFTEGRELIRTVQGGAGSGADVAASVFGGLLAYRTDGPELTPLAATHPITVVYSGSKTPTPQVIRLVEEVRRRMPAVFDRIFDAMHESSSLAVAAIRRGDWSEVGQLMTLNHRLMAALGVSTLKLDEIVRALTYRSGILGAKISGAGLGDCVIALGDAGEPAMPYEMLPVAMEPQGVQIHDH